MNAKRFLYWAVIGVLATLGLAVWMTGPAHGQCLGWLWNSYYETTYGHCGCETCQPTYFVPRLRPSVQYCACGYSGYCSCRSHCHSDAGPHAMEPSGMCEMPYPPSVAQFLQPAEFERLGEVPNDMMSDPAIGAR